MRLHYVYILQSESYPAETYKGLTDNIEDRLSRHNRGEVKYTSKFTPWKVIFLAGFISRKRASDFEKYLKSGSGIAFTRKRLIETHLTHKPQ